MPDATPRRPAADAAPRPPSLRLPGPVLFLVIVLAVGGLNAHYLFATELYERGDLAANSLAIREAKHFQRLTGQYSRWGFSHPGPGWFYAMAAGEALFYDALRLTPTSWNAQLLAVLLINGAFLAAAVTMVAHGMSGGRDDPAVVAVTTVGACLVVSVLHLAALGSRAGLPDCWTPYLMTIPFACLVIAAASVGAGRGTDLLVLTLAGAALLHSHVVAALQGVGPLFHRCGGDLAGQITPQDLVHVSDREAHKHRVAVPRVSRQAGEHGLQGNVEADQSFEQVQASHGEHGAGVTERSNGCKLSDGPPRGASKFAAPVARDVRSSAGLGYPRG